MGVLCLFVLGDIFCVHFVVFWLFGMGWVEFLFVCLFVLFWSVLRFVSKTDSSHSGFVLTD